MRFNLKARGTISTNINTEPCKAILTAIFVLNVTTTFSYNTAQDGLLLPYMELIMFFSLTNISIAQNVERKINRLESI